MRNIIPAVLFIISILSGHAQGKVQFHEWPKSQKKEILGIESTATSGHVVAWHVGGRGYDRGSKMKLNSYDRHTGAMVAEKEVPWKSTPMRQPQVDKGIEWNNALYLFAYAVDQGARRLELSYAAYDPATLAEVVPWTVLETFEKYRSGGSGFTLVPSPDRSKLLVYHGRYTTKGDTKNIFYAVLDAQKGLVRKAEKQLEMDHKNFIVQGHAVSDDGVVDLLARIKEGEKKDITYSSAVYRLGEEDMTVIKITPPGGLYITGATMVNGNGNTQIYGFLSSDPLLESTTHVFKASMTGTDDVGFEHAPLSQPLDSGIGTVTHSQGDGGSTYLTGTGLQDPYHESRLSAEGVILRVTNLYVCKLNGDMSVAWDRVQEFQFTHKDIQVKDHVALVADDRLVILLPGSSGHLKTYREGKGPKGITIPDGVVRIDHDAASGKPTYNAAGGDENDLTYWRFVELQDGRSVYFSVAKKNKKDGFAFLTL